MRVCSTSSAILAIVAMFVTGCSNDDGTVNNNGGGQDLGKKGSVAGRVTDVMGRPLAGVTVLVSTANTSVLTGTDGSFSIGDLPVATHTLSISHGGFSPKVIQTSVTENATAAVNTELVEMGLLAAYPLNGSGIDASGNGHNGLVSLAQPTPDRFGGSDRAMYFNGSALVTVPHSPIFNFSGSFSIGAWVKLRGDQENYTGLVAKGPSGTDYPGYMLLIMSGNAAGTATGQPEYVVLSGTANLNDNRWHYLTLVTDASTRRVTVYVDAVVQATESKPTLGLAFTNDRPLFIGVERNLANYFTGDIDDVRIFNRALTPGEIEQLVSR